MSTENLTLDFAASPDEQGFRLHRLEVYNWGTFHQKVWTINPDGYNAFATGDVGSGKSTLVDAITTLLVPPRRIVYNKAAGADTKERDLATYVRGAYKTEKAADSHRGKAAYLRDERSYSVVLAAFYNKSLDQGVTLAQVFHAGSSGTIDRFYVVAERKLGIADDFVPPGGQLAALKRALRKDGKAEIHDSFTAYATHFRRLLGIRSEQALDLFFQTVSMKSVDNLTAFVREHMLERWPVEEAIEEQCRNFEDLDRLHATVVRARQQIELLRPLIEACDHNEQLREEALDLRGSRAVLSAFFAERKTGLYERKRENLEAKLARLEERIAKSVDEKAALSRDQNGLLERIHERGGSRLQTLEQLIEASARERNQRQSRFEAYRHHAATLGLEAPDSPEAFVDNKAALETLEQSLRESREAHKKSSVGLGVELQKRAEEVAALDEEVLSLKTRKSSIPSQSLAIRAGIVRALEITEDRLPFAGELLQVKAEHSEWEGGAERVLRPFALSLLVPADLYPRVSKHVDETNIRGKLVYFRADTTHAVARAPREENSLVEKLAIKAHTPFHDWLWDELCQRFDYACCESIADFQRRPTAVTKQGQIKSGGKRHEKDDRSALHDRSRYVLGWENRAKITALEGLQESAKALARELAARIENLSREMEAEEEKVAAAHGVRSAETFEEIDWKAAALRLNALEEEKRGLETKNADLRALREQLEKLRGEQRILEDALNEANAHAGGLRNELANTKELLGRCDDEARGVPRGEKERAYPTLERLGQEGGLLDKLDLQNIEKRERDLREALTAEIDAVDKRIERKGQSVVAQMKDYLHRWPEEAKNIDASIEAHGEFREILGKLEREDLPRHEARFKQKLNEDTINGIALFQERLDSEARQIREKIDAINASLRQIDYTPGSYVRLIAQRSADPEILDFTDRLRKVISHSIGNDGLYTEGKFLAVKEIIDRFKGREGLVDGDRRWTAKVSDVRNWYHFAAIELWREDDSEKEYHPDSGGKSGGQKEKLAYTVLAAALAYQFALSGKESRARTFRLVAIDEAFGRGSDDSTRYALELFRKLDLQLFIVTPLQKVNVIENYVQRVHFVHNADGKNSQVRNMTLEQYRKERDDHANAAQRTAHQGAG